LSGPLKHVSAERPLGADVLGLDHVQVAAPAGCEAEARRFFGELLGLPEIDKPAVLRARGGVWFALGEEQLHIGVEEPFSPSLKAHLALRVAPETLDSLASRLRAAGGRVTWDDALPGGRRFYTEDPWGNRLEFVSAG
jgi:catechol 2,3-dioxygenase-like lactoylglutathione lyase family enzyme